jgi:hypothetical protein
LGAICTAKGIDNTITGSRQFWTCQPAETYTHSYVKALTGNDIIATGVDLITEFSGLGIVDAAPKRSLPNKNILGNTANDGARETVKNIEEIIRSHVVQKHHVSVIDDNFLINKLPGKKTVINIESGVMDVIPRTSVKRTTFFPVDWTESKIIDATKYVVKNGEESVDLQKNLRAYIGTYDNVPIKVYVNHIENTLGTVFPLPPTQ